MFALVSPNGAYHGHVKDVAEGRAIVVAAQHGSTGTARKFDRLLTPAEWGQVVAAGDDKIKRAELCGTLGVPA